MRQVYAEAFHTGPIPTGRNHIAYTCGLQVNSRPTSPDLSFWIDLDKVATQLNTHLQINPPYRFEVKYEVKSLRDRSTINEINWTESTRSAVNSVQNPSSMNAYFLIGCIMSGTVSASTLLIAALAVASIITTLSTAGILTAVGVGLVAGVASYCFFKARSGVNTTVAPIEESASENIEDIFRNHFAAAIGMTILPQDRVEIIDDEQALRV